MARDHVGGAKKALEGFFKRQSNQAKKKAKPRAPGGKKNASPEKDLVEVPCVAWMEARGWSGQIYESKAKFINGRWKSSGLKFGTADWQGCDAEGHAAIVEFKAPGKLGSFWDARNERQQEYIINKINAGAFAVVVDSDELLAHLYAAWHGLRRLSIVEAKTFLHDSLPPRPPKRKEPEGSETFGLF